MLQREVKLRETLAELIKQSKLTRKRICLEIGITPSALSQYLHGDATPSLSIIVQFANFFHVSLDHLVFQTPEETPPPETTIPDDGYNTLVGYIHHSMSSIQGQNLRHTQLVERIGQALGNEIDKKAREIAQLAPALSDIWPDVDLSILEKYSKETKILTLDLRYDLLKSNEANGKIVEGPFFSVVAQNLKQKHPYQFLIVGTVPQWRAMVSEFYALLPRHLTRHLEFRCTFSPIGCGFYHLDVAALERDEPMLYARVHKGIDPDGWVGYILSVAQDIPGDLKMDIKYIQQARATFDTLWERGEKFS